VKRTVLWDPAAWAEVEDAFDYYAERSRRAAEAFRSEIILAVERLAESAEAYPLFDEGVRRCLLDKYPFGILFVVDDDHVVIVVVMHTSRRPGYWKNPP